MANQKPTSFGTGTILTVLFALSAAQNVRSQVLYGSLVGNVRDASDAVVAAASVTITNLETNFTRQTSTNESGAYDFAAVPAGTYVLKVSKEGVSAYTGQGLQGTINPVSPADRSPKVGRLTH